MQMPMLESFTRWGKGRFIGSLSLGALLIPVLAGCGGGGGKESSGTAARRGVVRVALDWGGASRTSPSDASPILPLSANSVIVTVRDASGFTDSRTVNRPAQSGSSRILLEFIALNEGTAEMTARAFTGADGQGEPVAESAAQYDLARNQTPEKQVFFSVIYSKIVVTPDNVTINQGAIQAFAAQGVTESGVVTAQNLRGVWASSNPLVATTNGNVVTARQPGTTTISFMDNFGRVGTAALTVRGGDAEVNIQ